MTRREDWEVRLFERIEEWRGREFSYGKTDCCAFGGSVVEAITGTDPWAEWSGTYNDAESAMAALRSKGYKTLYAALVATLGKALPVAVARRGDPVYASHDTADFPQVGICLGQLSISWGSESGLIQVPTLNLKRAWHV